MELSKKEKTATVEELRAVETTLAVIPAPANSKPVQFVTTRMRNAASLANSPLPIPSAANRLVSAIRKRNVVVEMLPVLLIPLLLMALDVEVA